MMSFLQVAQSVATQPSSLLICLADPIVPIVEPHCPTLFLATTAVQRYHVYDKHIIIHKRETTNHMD